MSNLLLQTVYSGVTYAGYVGILTGQRPNSFTVSIDARRKLVIYYHYWIDAWQHLKGPIRLPIFSKSPWPEYCCLLLLLFLIFSHFYVGSMCLMRRLHLARSWASSLDNSLSDKSFLILSNHLRFGLPLLLFPSTSIAITLLPTYSSSLLNTCLLSCTFLDISPTFVVPLILYFLILSSLVTPLIHLNILISTTSNFFSCAFFTA